MLSNQTNDAVTLSFLEEPTANSLNDLLQHSYQLLDQHASYREVIIDMGKVHYIDSAGITFLIGLYKNLIRNQKSLRIVGAKKEIRDLFAIVNLTDLFQVEA